MGRVRCVELRPEPAPGGARAPADQQSNSIAPEPSHDAGEHGEESTFAQFLPTRHDDLGADADQHSDESGQGIAFNVNATNTAFAQTYPQNYPTATTTSTLHADAHKRWQDAMAAFQQTMQVQAQIAQNVQADSATLTNLVNASQGAEGNLQVTQAGNQLLALSTKQQLQIENLMAAQYRATALEEARNAEAEEEGRAAFQPSWEQATPTRRNSKVIAMNNLDVIDQFMQTFIRYIDSGFGLLNGDVAALTSILIAIDVTIAGLFWAMDGEANVLGPPHQENSLCRRLCLHHQQFLHISRPSSSIRFRGLGLQATGSGLTAQDLLRPGKLAGTGFQAAWPLLQQAGQYG